MLFDFNFYSSLLLITFSHGFIYSLLLKKQSKKLYQSPKFLMNEITNKLDTNTSVISKIINQEFGIYNDYFITHYRIEAVKKMFLNGEHKKSTLISIAYDCEFNSKATFNRAFKKSSGLTPKEYLTQLYKYKI